jgi:hypothetical protein
LRDERGFIDVDIPFGTHLDVTLDADGQFHGDHGGILCSWTEGVNTGPASFNPDAITLPAPHTATTRSVSFYDNSPYVHELETRLMRAHFATRVVAIQERTARRASKNILDFPSDRYVDE